MQLHDLQPAPGSKKNRKRVGRGPAAGQGKTAGRGTKGQNSRSGGGVRPYFEGGQLPLVRRLPHLRGFTNIWRVEFKPVNLERLGDFAANSEVTPEALAAAGIIKAADRVAILAKGELDRPLAVKAHRVSQAAQAKILAAGGTVEIIEA
ncbi:MAG: 50S ribosomal protein L15 [Caldilineales bacterium]